MSLWIPWLQAVQFLRPACTRYRTHLWMVLVLMGLCCRMDLAGVTSFVRVLGFQGKAYHRFLHLFHSKALDLDKLTACWARLCLTLFQPFEVGSRLVVLADGIKAPKEGKRMTLRYRCLDLMWRPAGRMVRFVIVRHPHRGTIFLLSTDLTLAPLEILQLYGYRFRIEVGFRQAVHVLGAYGYHFWMEAPSLRAPRAGARAACGRWRA